MKLLLSPRLSEDSIALWTEASQRRWDVDRLRGWRATGDTPDAIYGEALWARVVCRQYNRWLLEPPLDWVTRLPHDLVKRHLSYCRLKDVPFTAFVKPPDDKIFPAQVWNDFPPLIDFDTMVIASDVVNFRSEMRFWLLDGQVRASAMYRGDMNVATRAEANRLAEVAADAIPTPRAVVIDVGLMERGLAIVEANPAFCSGIYGAEGVLPVVAAACVTEGPPEFIQGVTVSELDGQSS